MGTCTAPLPRAWEPVVACMEAKAKLSLEIGEAVECLIYPLLSGVILIRFFLGTEERFKSITLPLLYMKLPSS